MNLPLQAPPVSRQVSQSKFDANHVTGSGIPCTLCKLACDRLSGIAKQLCLLACNKTVC